MPTNILYEIAWSAYFLLAYTHIYILPFEADKQIAMHQTSTARLALV